MGRMTSSVSTNRIRVGMVGLGMIFEETYRPLFEQLRLEGLYRRDFSEVDVELVAVASRTGSRAESLKRHFEVVSCIEPDAVGKLLREPVDAVCIATPDDRHFPCVKKALEAGKHVLIEKPAVLSLMELDELVELARRKNVLAKVVYHKLADPDHKMLRTRVADGILRHVNNGYCSLLEPKSISRQQFSEWIAGRNPATYVACHYLKLIDFTFGPDWRLARISGTGQRGLVGPTDGTTWDSVQLQVVYTYTDNREAAFDIHTSWVTPDNFPGYVEQEVQFRFDNGVWNSHQRKRGVEVTIEDRSPIEFKYTPNHHYSGKFKEPSGERSQRGYGIEVLRRFFEEVAFVEFGGNSNGRDSRLEQMQNLAYNDLSADRNVVAAVQAIEAILRHHAEGCPGGVVTVNAPRPGLWLWLPGQAAPIGLYQSRV